MHITLENSEKYLRYHSISTYTLAKAFSKYCGDFQMSETQLQQFLKNLELPQPDFHNMNLKLSQYYISFALNLHQNKEQSYDRDLYFNTNQIMINAILLCRGDPKDKARLL